MVMSRIMHKFVCRVCYEWVPSRVMRKIVCRLWLNEVSRQWRYPQGLPPWLNRPVGHCLRVRKILDEAADELAALKKAGNYNPIEIARVFRKACAKLGEKEVKSAIIKPLMDEIGLYESSDAAAKAFGSLAGPMTKNNHKEQYATIYSVTIGSKKVYFNGNIQTGGHNNVFTGLMVNGVCFIFAVVIPMLSAPPLVLVHECLFGSFTNTLTMPKLRCEVHPLLTSICTGRTIE